MRRFHWFSPLPPARTGIAEIAECTAPALARLADVTLWTPAESWSAELEKVAPVKHFDPGTTPLPQGKEDVCVYHIGGRWDFHAAIWRAAVKNPGIVVLHDLRVPGLFIHEGLRNTPEMAKALSELALSPEQVLEALKVNDESPTWEPEHSLLLRLAIARARAVVVHTAGALELLEHAGVSGVRAHLPYRRPASLGQTPAPARERGPGSPRRLLFLGHIGPYRRLPSVLQALAGMKEREAFHLDVYGSSRDNFGQLRALAAASGIRDCVKYHGFASDDVIESALGACDAAINLRHPSKGECSLSQLRLWSHAVPTIVTREGWYAELGNDVVTYVRPDHEIDDLRAALRSLLTSPAEFGEKGRRGLERLETLHSPERYAQSFVSLAESLSPLGPAMVSA